MALDISEVIGLLDHGLSGRLQADGGYCAINGIESEAPAAAFYIQPSLRVTAKADSPAIALISAPAAVGKTALARHLQRELSRAGRQTLYVPLQQANIGSDFFTGRLASVFPGLSKREYLDAVFSGRVVLLFDGYDEVTMRSDQVERNKLFIRELHRELDEYELRSGSARLSIVFLFRSVFAEFGVFDDVEPRALSITVEFLSPDQRKSFLAAYLDTKAREAGRMSAGHLAGAFLDGFQTRLSRATDEADAFFGHAIVLSAFGDFLHEQDERNAARLAENLATDIADESTSVAILSTVIETILEREVRKFPTAEYSSKLNEFSFYPPELQEELLRAIAEDLFRGDGRTPNGQLELAIAGGVDQLRQACSHLPEADRDALVQAYREELRRRINHHPFLDVPRQDRLRFRNPVYREFYLAQSVTRSTDKNWDALTRADDASHYLALFFLHHVADRDLAPFTGFLFHFVSLLASASAGNDFLFRLVWDDQLKVWNGAVDSTTIQTESFVVSDSILVIEMPRRGVLQNVDLRGNGNCVIAVQGPSHEDNYFQPVVLRECVFEADTVSLAAAAIRLEGLRLDAATVEFDDVVMSMDGLHTLDVARRNGAPPNIVMSDYVRKRYHTDIDSAVEPDGAGELEFQTKMRKLLLWFRKHGRPDYACYDKKFKTCALNNNRDHRAMALADFLFSQGILVNDESVVVLDQDRLSTFDVAYLKQNELSFGTGSHRLFSTFQKSAQWAQFNT